MQIASDFTYGSDLTNQFTSLQFTNKIITIIQRTFDRATLKGGILLTAMRDWHVELR
ncbi:MAG TPA: hypothetical protein VN939_23905 [Chthoniobacterales bacterium]|nr:hypothetical protein [Chthoniobacterales bacterium]